MSLQGSLRKELRRSEMGPDFFRAVQKPLKVDKWFVNGVNHKGSHFPICVFTKNRAHRSRDAKIRRGEESKEKLKKNLYYDHLLSPPTDEITLREEKLQRARMSVRLCVPLVPGQTSMRKSGNVTQRWRNAISFYNQSLNTRRRRCYHQCTTSAGFSKQTL